MQSRLVLRRCTVVHGEVANSQRRSFIDRTRSCNNCSTNSNVNSREATVTQSKSLKSSVGNTLTDKTRLSKQGYQIPLTLQCNNRYLQTSSRSKSLTSTSALFKSASSATATATSTSIDNFTQEDQVLKFANENIRRLLRDELYSIENQMQDISPFGTSVFRDGNIGSIKDDTKSKNTNLQNRKKNQTMAELLKECDITTQPSPKDTPLDEIQLWFECIAQQESVQKYQAIIDSARGREDYTSLSVVQHHLLEWYGPLRQRILEEQEKYLVGGKDMSKSIKKYGPLLCTLQAEKLAILTTHEATLYTLLQGGDSAKLVAMALKIADAVEAEVNVQRLLKKRLDESGVSVKGKVNNKSGEGEDGDSLSEKIQLIFDNDKVQNENANTKKRKDLSTEWMYGPSHLQNFVDELNRSNPGRKGKVRIQRANKRAMKLLESSEPWSSADKVSLGVVLINMLMETAKVNFRRNGEKYYNEENNHGVPAFIYERKWFNVNNLVGCISMNKDFYKMVVEDKFDSLDAFTSRYKPMVVPPREWNNYNDGGYMVLQAEFMRAKGCGIQRDALKEGDLSIVMDGLNVLGRVPWKINKSILSAAERCWDEGIVLGDIPSRVDHELPSAPIRPEGNTNDYESAKGEFRAYREALIKYRRVHQKNMDLRSLRCSAILKLNQSNQFKDFERIYFPYNIDFRGRAYPVPPHLSNIGSDLCRGMLTFAEPKPLGPRGLYWLKVHLANLAGNDKISFDDRAAFTENNMENVRACVEDPFGENRWWMTLDDPFQAMATCHEIVNAINSGSPETYACSLPVHMDGSCNGLQHYAAIGRDTVGGKAVNLLPGDKPEDVYSGVMQEVIKRVADEAERLLDIDESNPESLTKNERKALANHRAARLVNGLIDRGVVKRTVMTSVYGVTYIGAKKQIQEKIEEKLEAQGVDVDERADEIYAACGYLATLTMEVMGDLFQGARQTMNWLATCAKLISSQGQPVSWISPTGVPAVQPYRQKQPYRVVTLLQTVILINNTDNLPIHKSRQTSAFPPNYIHSLDSAHMLLTAIEMEKRGLTFSAVHDSFWTHAADIDEMNDVLRCCFIDLYNRPLLQELKETWEIQYPSLEFPDLPKTGDLDLNEVRKAPYFFQ